MRKVVGWAASAALVVLLGGCGSASPAAPTATDGPLEKGVVILRDIEFKPARITVDAGDTVTWRFEDQGITHDVVADDRSFKSSVEDSGTFRHTFDKRGTYTYKCSLHPVKMKGTIVVR